MTLEEKANIIQKACQEVWKELNLNPANDTKHWELKKRISTTISKKYGISEKTLIRIIVDDAPKDTRPTKTRTRSTWDDRDALRGVYQRKAS